MGNSLIGKPKNWLDGLYKGVEPYEKIEIVKKEDLDFLAQSAYDDACRPGNPRETSVAEIKALYESLL